MEAHSPAEYCTAIRYLFPQSGAGGIAPSVLSFLGQNQQEDLEPLGPQKPKNPKEITRHLAAERKRKSVFNDKCVTSVL